MKHKNKISAFSSFFNKKSVYISCGVLLLVVSFSVGYNTIFTNTTIHDSELSFVETSSKEKIIGGMLPASCESGGNGLSGPGHTDACVWTTYCSGSPAWEYRRLSNDDTPDDESLGTSCRPTGSLSVSATTCTIPTGSSNCSVNITWSTTLPWGTSAVTRTNPNQTQYNGNSGGPSGVIIYGATPSATFFLYNASLLLASRTVTASCAAGTHKWDTIGGKCENPQVVSAVATGNYYNMPGTLTLQCSGSDSYEIYNTTTGSTTGTYSNPSVSANATVTGNYTFICKKGTVSSDPVVRYWNSPPPPAAIIDLKLDPPTVDPDEDVTLTWDVKFPVPACTITAKVVCTNNACSASQTASQAELNAIFTSQNTDLNDPNGSRPIPTAVTTLASPAQLDTTFKALGKKTFKVKYTTDITYDCNPGGPGQKETKRINVTRSVLR